MVDGVAAFAEDVSCRFPGTSTAVHYVSDIQVFLRWLGGPPDAVRFFTIVAAMQVLASYLHFYSWRRPHLGYRLQGRTPAEVFHHA